MIKNTFMPIVLLIFIIGGIFMALDDSYALDAPHNGSNAMTCATFCHATSGYAWKTQTIDPSIDQTYANNLCKSCHNNPPGLPMSSKAQDAQTHSSFRTSASYGIWGLECRTCHNPHYQKQISTYPSSSINSILTGTITSVTTPNRMTVQLSSSITASTYIDYIIIPDINNPFLMYQITDNTAGTTVVITTSPIDPLNTYYVMAGNSVVVRYNGQIKDRVTTPNSGVKAVQFFNNTGPKSFASGTNPADGICQVCHTKTRYFLSDGSVLDAGHPAPAGSNCTASCHQHKFGFKADCTQCHGSPPLVNTPGGPSGLAYMSSVTPSVTGAQFAGAHNAHANSYNIDCGVCHDNATGSGLLHKDNTMRVKMGFNIVVNGANVGGRYDGQTTANYLATNGLTSVTKTGTMRCNNVYCHSSGQGLTGNAATPVYSNPVPVWNNPATSGCGICHGVNSATMTTGNHTQHLTFTGVTISCGDCHTGATSSTYTSANHINGLIDVAKGYTMGGAPGNNYGSCGSSSAPINCHGNGTPTWGMNVTGIDKCTVCHGSPTAGTMGSSASYSIAPAVDLAQQSTGAKVGAHTAHLKTNAISRPLLCNECHVIPALSPAGIWSHINDTVTPGVAEVTFASGTYAYANGASPNYIAGACNNTYCHGARMPRGSTGGADSHPTWSDTGYITGVNTHDCAQCHGFPPTTVAVNSHMPGGNPVAATSCTGCHNAVNALGTGFTSSGLVLHINGYLEATGCDGCHGNPPTTATYGGTTGLVGVALGNADTGATSPLSPGAHNRHVNSESMNCDACHAGSPMGASVFTSLRIYMGFKIDSATFPGFVGSASTGTFAGYNALSSGYSWSASYPGTQVTTTNNRNNTCSSVYCHGAWGVNSYGTDTSPNWINPTTGACNTCHGASAAIPPRLGAHERHTASLTSTGYQYACTLCHNATPHVDGKSQVAFNVADTRVALGSYGGTSTMLDAYGNCSNLYCHSNAIATVTATLLWSSSTPMPLDCTGCHGGNAATPTASRMSSNAHTNHISSIGSVGRLLACGDCHNATVNTSSDRSIPLANKSIHVDKLVNVKFFDNAGAGLVRDSDGPTYNGQPTTGLNGATVAPNTVFGSCNNVYCHSSGNLTGPGGSIVVSGSVPTYKQPDWNVTPVGCSGCHGSGTMSHPTYTSGAGGSNTANSHVKHVNSGMGCAYCHVNTVGSNTTTSPSSMPANTWHLNRTEDVAFLAIGGITGAYNSTVNNKTCSATYCHGTLTTSPSWGAAGSTNCNSCHDSFGTGLSGAHDKHYNTTVLPTSIASNTNHYPSGYVYGCGNCHPSNLHAGGPDSALGDANISTSGQSKISAYVSGGTATTDARGWKSTVGGSCTNSCHTDGKVPAGPPTYPALAWTAPDSNCWLCHGSAAVYPSNLTAAHYKHIYNYAYSGGNFNLYCGACHAATMVPGSSSTFTTNGLLSHLNGVRDVQMDAFSGGAGVTIAGPQGNQTCSNTYCHSKGTAANGIHSAVSWTGTMTCTGCHGASAATLTTGAHAKHLQTWTPNGMITCRDCHEQTTSTNTTITNYPNHVNKNVTIALSAASSGPSATYAGSVVGGGSYTNKLVGTAAGTCNTTYCHGGNSQSWSTVNNFATCVKCHGVGSATPTMFAANPDLAAPGYISVSNPTGTGVNTLGTYGTYSSKVSNDPKVGAHDVHNRGAGGYTNGIACNECHAVTALNSAGHMNGQTTFVWGTVASTSTTPTYIAATNSCATNYCHGAAFNAVTTMGTDTTPIWTDGAYLLTSAPASASNKSDCDKCHLSPPSTGTHVSNGVTFSATACNGCHGHNGNGATHVNGIVEQSGSACDSCHAYDVDPITLDWGKNQKAVEGWGAHAVHINHLTALSGVTLSATGDQFNTANFNAVCGVCHARSGVHDMGGTPNTRTINFGGVNDYQFAVSSGTPTYLGVTGVSSAVTPKTCSNISCHFQGSPVWEGL